MTDMEYLFVGEHADTLASGRHVAPGDTIPVDGVDPDDPHDELLISEGRLVQVQPATDADYDSQGVPALEDLARQRGIYEQIEGTGADGNVVKKDLVNALQAHDADKEEE